MHPHNQNPLRRETVLVVDDDFALQTLLAQMLEACGFTVLAAGSGAAALRIWGESKVSVDLLLTDINMPGMSGLQLASTLRDERPDLKVIFMTGHSGDFTAEGETLIEGVNLLSKPCRMQTLANAVRARLESRD